MLTGIHAYYSQTGALAPPRTKRHTLRHKHPMYFHRTVDPPTRQGRETANPTPLQGKVYISYLAAYYVVVPMAACHG
jgi:hypothetical protein